MSTSTIPSVLDGLVDALALVAALSGVGIYSGPAGDSRGVDTIELGIEVTIDETPMALGGTRLEKYALDCEVYSVNPGAKETGIRAARDSVFTLFAAIETYLNDNPTIGGLCLDADLAAGKLKQGYSPEGRHASLEFKINVQAVINP